MSVTTMNLFLAICFIPVLFLMYFTILNERKPKNNPILSTTLPKEAWNDPRVLSITGRFTRQLTILCLVLLLAYLPALFMSYISIILTYTLLWLDAIIVFPSIIYARSVKQLRELKKANWYHPELVKVQVADTSLASVFEEKQNSYTFVHFLLPLLVSLIPLLYPIVVPQKEGIVNSGDIFSGSSGSLLIIVLCNAVSVLLMYFCYRMLRKKEDRVNSDITLSAVLTRIRRYYWGKCWLYLAWFLSGFSFSVLLLYCSETAFIVALGLLTLVIFIIVVVMEFKIRSEQQRLNKEQPTEILMDEDDYWPYGLMYYNKNDSSLLVNSRIGLGSTTNSAHPVGIALNIFTLVLLLVLPFTGAFLVKEEFTEPTVILTDFTLEAQHLRTEYSIPLETISSLALLNELPALSKTWGSNYPHLYKGKFTLSESRQSSLLRLDPYDTLFLMVQTTDAKTYLFSMEDTEELEHIYHLLLSDLSR